MERTYKENIVAEMLLIQEAYLKVEKEGDKDAKYLRAIYNTLVSENIQKIISENRESFKTTRSIEDYMMKKMMESPQ